MKKRQIIAGLMVVVTLSGMALAHATLSEGKISKASQAKIEQTIATNPEEMDYAYMEMYEEENYIVNLVSTMTGKDLEKSDWKECLEYLEANYDTLINNESYDTQKIKSYVETYQIVEAEENGTAREMFKAEEVVTAGPNGEVATGTNSNYNVEKVKEYIDKHWEDYNTAQYPDFTPWGGDCANFVSQCIHAGGKEMKGTNASSFSNWFCRTNVTENFSQTSSTWRGAQAFASYWTTNAVDYKDFPYETFQSDEAFHEFFHSAEVGDAMSIFTENRAYHTVIIRHKDRDGDGTIRFAAHTGPQYERDIKKYVGSHVAKVRLYKMGNKLPTEIPEYVAPEPTPEPSIEPSTPPVEQTPERRGFWSRLFGR